MSVADLILNGWAPPVGGVVTLPPPTGTVSDDTALAAAIAKAVTTGAVIVAKPGVYSLQTAQTIPGGVDLRGQGGGSSSQPGATVFRCDSAAAQINIAGGGGLSGFFQINGNLTATTPFQRSGGTGANAREFSNLTVRNNAVSGTNANDLALFYGAQNDSWYQCGFAAADRDLAWFDQGYGGAKFDRCQWSGAGRYHHRFDNVIAGGVYAKPTNIKFDHNITEGNGGASIAQMTQAALITYDNHSFYTINALTGPHLNAVNATDISLINPFFQSTAATRTAGTVAIAAANASTVSIIGRAYYLNFDTVYTIAGLTAFIYDQPAITEIYNNTTVFTGSGGATLSQLNGHVWATPASGNGTQRAGLSLLGYTKLRNGLVVLRGALSNCVAGATAIMTLPVGYRPALALSFPILTFSGAPAQGLGWAGVDAAGVVTFQAGSPAFVYLDSISFVADA